MEDLIVTGSSNLYNVAVAGSATVGSLLIENNSILSLAWDLKLSALSNIKLFENAVVISKDGTIQTKGKIIAEDGIKTNRIEPLTSIDKVTISNLATNNLAITDKYINNSSASAIIAASENFERNGISAPAIETETASAGNALIPENSQEVIIYNENITDNSLIYLTSTSPSPSASLLTVVKKESCTDTPEVNPNPHENTSGVENSKCKKYFKASLAKPAEIPVTFNWLIIN